MRAGPAPLTLASLGRFLPVLVSHSRLHTPLRMKRYNETEVAWCRQGIVELATSILRGDLGVLEGSRRMLAFRFCAGIDEFDQDLLTFVSIESQEDHLPLSAERQHWSPAALAGIEVEIAEAEQFHRSAAHEACESLLRRFRSPAETAG